MVCIYLKLILSSVLHVLNPHHHHIPFGMAFWILCLNVQTTSDVLSASATNISGVFAMLRRLLMWCHAHITQEMSTKDMIHWQIVRKKNCIPWLVEVSGYHWMESVVKIILYQKPSECCSWWKIATVTCNFSRFSAYIISRAIVNLKVRHKLEAKK